MVTQIYNTEEDNRVVGNNLPAENCQFDRTRDRTDVSEYMYPENRRQCNITTNEL